MYHLHQISNCDQCSIIWHYGSVYIGLILLKLKTYCWNHCSKIIFKCVNNTVGPIFNEKIDKKWNLWVCEQYTDALFKENWSKVAATVHVPYMNSSCLWGGKRMKKKKKKKRRKRRNWNATQQTPTQTHTISVLQIYTFLTWLMCVILKLQRVKLSHFYILYCQMLLVASIMIL